MVRLSFSNLGRCLFGILSLCIVSSMTLVQSQAGEKNTYNFPKGIVLNSGQYPSSVYGYAHIGNAIVWLDQDGLLFDVKSDYGGHVIRMKFQNTNLQLEKGDIIQKRNVITGNSNGEEYIIRDASLIDEHGTNISTFSFHESGMKWTMHDSDSQFSIEGVDSISFDDANDFIQFHIGNFRYEMRAPMCESKTGELLKTRIVQTDNGILRFVEHEKKGEALQGIPIVFSTFIGGSSAESINAVTLDQKGNIYVLGETDSPDYPISSGAYSSPNAVPKDLFVAKFDSTGSNILYSARIGGDFVELGTSIAVDNLGQACIVGSTTSKNFPSTPNAFQSQKLFPNEDVFAIKLNSSGNALVYGTFMIGMTTDIAHSITVDEKGDMYLAGATSILSRNPHTFPKTPNAYDTSFNGGSTDVFVAKINPAGKGDQDLQFCTLIGGNEVDIAYKIVLAKNGDVIVAGETSSDSLFPTMNGAVQSTFRGVSDGFIAILSPNGDSLKYSTLMGGSGYERITGLVFDEQSQSIFFAGYTNSSGLPSAGNQNPIMFPVTKGSYDTVYNGGIYDGFVGKLNPFIPNGLRYASFIGGSGDDYILGLGIDVCAAPYVTGSTNSLDFPITDDASDTTIKKSEGFITKLNALANVLVFSSFLGNDDDDQLNGIQVDQSGAIFLGGSVQGSQIPGSNRSTNGRDGFLAKIQVGILPLKPTINNIGSLSFCKGDSVILDASSRNFVSYQWRKNSVIIPGANAPKLTVSMSGVYSVDVADASGCTGTEFVTVTAFDRPGLTIAQVPVICPGDTAQISATTTDSLEVIAWSPPIGLSCLDCLNPKVAPPMSMTYTLKTIDTNGCVRFDTVKVDVIDSTALIAKSIQDTIYLCPDASLIINVPITNTSNVELMVYIAAFSNPALQSIQDSVRISADTSILIPIKFNGVKTTGPQIYEITFSDKCGSLKTAQCIINVQTPKFAYGIDSATAICRTEIAKQTIRIDNLNGLNGTISISSSDSNFTSNPNSFMLKPFGQDSINVEYVGNMAGLMPVKIFVNHECGYIDTLTWNIRVISNPYDISWKSDTTKHELDKSIVKTLEVSNLSGQSLTSLRSFDISWVHEYSALKLDSIQSNECEIIYSKDGDTIKLQMIDCADSATLYANAYFTPLVGETLKPWMKILRFSSKNACIDPVMNTPNDTIMLDSYGCELTTLKVKRANSQLKYVRMNQDQSLLSIVYANSEKISARFICINAVGQIAASISTMANEPGEHELSIPVQSLPNGIYTLIYESGNHVESSLFMKME
ncbi:MAG: SBBP repeat-containing protein [Candidatus Kapaibacteriota bacterium]